MGVGGWLPVRKLDGSLDTAGSLKFSEETESEEFPCFFFCEERDSLLSHFNIGNVGCASRCQRMCRRIRVMPSVTDNRGNGELLNRGARKTRRRRRLEEKLRRWTRGEPSCTGLCDVPTCPPISSREYFSSAIFFLGLSRVLQGEAGDFTQRSAVGQSTQCLVRERTNTSGLISRCRWGSSWI